MEAAIPPVPLPQCVGTFTHCYIQAEMIPDVCLVFEMAEWVFHSPCNQREPNPQSAINPHFFCKGFGCFQNSDAEANFCFLKLFTCSDFPSD